MEPLSLFEIIQATGGHLQNEGALCAPGVGGHAITSVCTDTRSIHPGCLFVALEGERFDGHDFLQAAFNGGAAAALSKRPIDTEEGLVILVEDTEQALLDLAAYYRSRLAVPVLAVTGSVGKTTVKELAACVLSGKFQVQKTQGNLNNHIGVPMTLFAVDSSYGSAVVEMGMNHPGEIRRLSAAARPDAALITLIGSSHIEHLGSKENILLAKLEVCEGLAKDGTLILNGDDELLWTRRSDFSHRLLFFGVRNPAADLRARDILPMPEGTRCVIQYRGESAEACIPVPGAHSVSNALAAVAAGIAFGMNLPEAVQGLARFQGVPMRQQIIRENGLLFIDDCYNAGPDSVKVALQLLGDIPAHGRKVAVLGDMLELGNRSAELHCLCGREAVRSKTDLLYAYGQFARCYLEGAAKAGHPQERLFFFSDAKQLTDALLKELQTGDAVLFKASRGVRLENVLQAVRAQWGANPLRD
jgi:UDP-N-acetylmuramoyl-tripeptide--D-alanyl-D-alanine ligase